MQDLNIVFIPAARTTFYMPSAQENFEKSIALVKDLHPATVVPAEMITSVEALTAYLQNLESTPDLVIFQCTTFVGAEFINTVTRQLTSPVVLWTVREPAADGGRLRLNSLTGAFSAGNSLFAQKRFYEFVFGGADEASVRTRLNQIIAAVKTRVALKNLTLGVVGTFPPGFAFGDLDEALLAKVLGSQVVRTEASAIMQRARSLSQEEIQPAIDELKGAAVGVDLLEEERLEKYARLKTAYDEFVKTNGIKAMASRCWPDFFVEFNAPVCGVLSLLNEKGVQASCEADLGGAITMFIEASLAGGAPYFGDPVALDEENNSIIFWHCGAGACSLARQDAGAKLGVHPNRKIGPTMEFGLKPGQVTVARLGKCEKGFRMFLMGGEALDEPQKFLGTSVTVRPYQNSAREVVRQGVEQGWEPHFAIVYGDIREEIKILCKLLNIEVYEY